jgi:putative ABC transport system permease protein
MISPRFIPVVFKQVLRHRTRSGLTVAGVALATFLYCAVQAMQAGVREATQAASDDATLVVYRENRFCPFTSRLPEHYLRRIEAIPHVKAAVPTKIVVNNCRASLDVITFRGIPEERVASFGFDVIEGSIEQWQSRGDAALLGETLAMRRGFKVGQSFDAAGITVYVAGIVRSDEAQDQNAAYVHLPFLQQATSKGGREGGPDGMGVVTQFNVVVDDSAHLETVARAIDDEFRNDSDPTYTSPEKAFVARAAADIIEIVRFTRWLGWAALAAVLALVGNAIVLSVQDRLSEHAILQTLGFRSDLIARLIISEGALLSVLGGTVGAVLCAAALHWGRFTMTVEGVSMNVALQPQVIAAGIAVSVVLGVVAGLVPAWRAGRREIAQCFRTT